MPLFWHLTFLWEWIYHGKIGDYGKEDRFSRSRNGRGNQLILIGGGAGRGILIPVTAGYFQVGLKNFRV
jgi:hypothetical protein